MRKSSVAAVLRLLFACLALGLASPAALAQDAGEAPAKREINCQMCHRDVAHAPGSVHADVGCQQCHSNVEKPRHKAEDLADLSGNDICAQCHRMAVRQIDKSVHGGNAGCMDCHGEAHGILPPDNLNSSVAPFQQVDTCGGCHRGKEGLIEGYLESVHGRGLLRSGLVSAPSCSDCHGYHRVVDTDDPEARTSWKKSPEMCGECHMGVLEEWLELSAHGMGWKNGDADAPVCTTCHSSHRVLDPTDPEEHLHLPEHCGDCHTELYSSYRHNFHGQFTELGLQTSATCADCHTAHKNLPADDPRSTVSPENVAATCGECHGDAPANFLAIDVHNDPSDPNDNPYVYWIYMFMLALLVGVFAFFGIHDLLWLQRAFVGTVRGEFHHRGNARETGPYVRRFRGLYIAMHITVILTFLLLALTGLPLKFSTAPWAQDLIDLLGGVGSAHFLHRLAAIGTFGYFAVHLVHLIIRFFVKHERGLFWGPNSMTPQLQDVKDLWANLKWFLYVGPHPTGGRWTYWEKFDYLAVFWGVAVIGLSGLILWFPEFFTTFLPGWAVNAAFVVHSDEALLATGFIFIFHFFHTHLRPESFPMDPVVFTGRMPLEKFKEERPREYEEMVRRGTLEANLCEAPTREEMIWVYVFGFSAVAIGLALAVAIFWGLFTHGLG